MSQFLRGHRNIGVTGRGNVHNNNNSKNQTGVAFTETEKKKTKTTTATKPMMVLFFLVWREAQVVELQQNKSGKEEQAMVGY